MRIAILDLGTNTFHLLIMDTVGDSRRIFKSRRTIKLGEGAIQMNRIAPAPFERGLRALEDYSRIIRKHRVHKVFAFATSAIRSAQNGKEFVREAFRRTGIRIRVITGTQEAGLIYYGVRSCVPLGTAPSLIVDIGGGSTEFIIATDKRILWKQSFNIGAARLLAMFPSSDPVSEKDVRQIIKFLDDTLKPLKQKLLKYPVERLVGSSGTFDTLAEMIGWRYHRRDVLKGVNTYTFDLDDYYRLHNVLLASTTQQRKKMKGLIKMRVDMIVPASISTDYILRTFGLKEMILSKYALKEGAFFAIVNKRIRL